MNLHPRSVHLFTLPGGVFVAYVVMLPESHWRVGCSLYIYTIELLCDEMFKKKKKKTAFW